MDVFMRTRMGQRLFGTTLPKIADELERLNRNLEALVAALAARPDAPGVENPTLPDDRPAAGSR